jgi:hypothetical protein
LINYDLKSSQVYIFHQSISQKSFIRLGQGFGLVVRAAGWHTGDPGSILGRDGLYTFGCTTPAP